MSPSTSPSMRSEPEVAIFPSIRVSCPMYVSTPRASAACFCLRLIVEHRQKIQPATVGTEGFPEHLRISCGQVRPWINRLSVDVHLVMDVRARTQAGAADGGDVLAALDHIPARHGEPRVV